MSTSQRTVTAPPMSWKTPRDTGNKAQATSHIAQTNINYGYLTALESKEVKTTKDLCRRSHTNLSLKNRGTQYKMRQISAPPIHSPQPQQQLEPVAMPPGSKESVEHANPQALPVLNSELIERTRYTVLFVAISLQEIDKQLDSIVLGQDERYQNFPMQTATNCSLIIGRANHNWQQIAHDCWGIAEQSQVRLPGPATCSGVRSAVAELIQIFLVEGALLFGRAEFETMDRVRHLVEALMSIQAQLEEVENQLAAATAA